MRRTHQHSIEPVDRRAFSQRFDRLYSRFARPYDLAVKLLRIWRRWLGHALPHIQGPCVLEVSPGTGWLLTQYAARYETHAIDLNRDSRLPPTDSRARAAPGVTPAGLLGARP